MQHIRFKTKSVSRCFLLTSISRDDWGWMQLKGWRFVHIPPTKFSWWRHPMETFSALLALCVGNSTVTGEFLSQRPVMQDFGVFFNLRVNKRLSKQTKRWWFETPSLSLWRHCNVETIWQPNRWSSTNQTMTLHFNYNQISGGLALLWSYVVYYANLNWKYPNRNLYEIMDK